MRLKWPKRRCWKCERLILKVEFEPRSRICKACEAKPTYNAEFMRKQVLLLGSVDRVARKLGLSVEIVRKTCGLEE